MKPVFATLILVLISAASLLAQQPAPLSLPSNRMVLIRPFTARGDQTPEWIGRSVAESLDAQARQVGLMPAREPALLFPPSDPLRSLQSRGIALLVDGVCESDGITLSVRGQVVDVPTQLVIGQLTADASPRDLLAMKDLLSLQFRKVFESPLPPPPVLRPAPAAPAAAPAPGARFTGSRLAQSLDDPDIIDRQYRRLYEEEPLDAAYYPMVYPGIYPYGFYYPRYRLHTPRVFVVPPPATVNQNSIIFVGHYRSSRWNIDFRVGAGSGAWGAP